MELSEVKPGQIILVEREIYDHYAVYAGGGEVIHYAPVVKGGEACVHRAGLERFLDGADRFFVPYLPETEADAEMLLRYHVRQSSMVQDMMDFFCNSYEQGALKVYTAAETLKRAIAKIGEKMYSLLFNNCEHFALWCKLKVYASEQVSRLCEFFKTMLLRNMTQRYHRFVVC